MNYDTKRPMPESRETSILVRFPNIRNVSDLPCVDSSRSSYLLEAWTLDNLRRRSPERVLGTSRGLSPTRNVEELHRRPLNCKYDDVRAVPYVSKDVLEVPRPVGMSPFVLKPTMPSTSIKPAPPAPPLLNEIPPSSGIVLKPPSPGEEQQTVNGLLHSLGLEKYALDFKNEEVYMTALKQMGEMTSENLECLWAQGKSFFFLSCPIPKGHNRD